MSSETEPTPISVDEGIQQIPTSLVRISPSAAAVDARDQLLRAIGKEAEYVADKFAGQASTPLEELARAFALVAAGPHAIVTPAAGQAATGRSSSYDILEAGIGLADFEDVQERY